MPITSFKAKIIKKIKQTDDHYELVLSKPEGFLFKAGQFVNICVEKAGEKKWRAYSLLSPPSVNTLGICFKVIPGGFATPVLREMKQGDLLQCKGPYGSMCFDSSVSEHWFIAAGSGIVPFYCLVNQFVRAHPDNRFKLIFGTRTKEDILYYDEFLQLEKECHNFTFVSVLSRQHWQGAEGHVQEHLGNELDGKTFYICGLKQMVLDTIKYLEDKGVCKKNIRFERYS